MAANIIRVNTNRLHNDAEQVNACINNMKSEMKKLKESSAQLDAMWDGPSSEAFKAAFADDLAALNTILGNLQKIYSYENTAKTKYEACENKVSSFVASIRV